MLHELETARDLLRDDQLAPALKCIARVKHIQKTLTEQWSVLATLTPDRVRAVPRRPGQRERLPVAPVPRGRVHARQQERGDAAGVRVGSAAARDRCAARSRRRASTTSSCACLARAGYPIPAAVLERDVTKAWTFQPELVPIFASIYANPTTHWAAYETCEELVDLEDNFQLWRFRHLKTVERIIGSKTGTGGSSGAPFLQSRARAHVLPRALRRAHRDPWMTDVARRPTHNA